MSQDSIVVVVSGPPSKPTSIIADALSAKAQSEIPVQTYGINCGPDSPMVHRGWSGEGPFSDQFGGTVFFPPFERKYGRRTMRVCHTIVREQNSRVWWPTSEDEIACIAQYRDSFSWGDTHLVVPETVSLDNCLDKRNLYGALKQWGYAVAEVTDLNVNYSGETKTFTAFGCTSTSNSWKIFETGMPLQQAIVEDDCTHEVTGDTNTPLPYPVVVKRGRYVSNREVKPLTDLQEVIETCVGIHDPFLQRYVAGTEYTIDTVPDQSGLPKIAIVQKKLNPEKSNGKAEAVVVLRDEALEQLAKDVVTKLGLKVPVNLDVIVESGTNTPYVLDVNPRFGRNCYVAFKAGVNVPLIVLKNILERDVQPQEFEFKTGFFDIKRPDFS